MRVTRPFLIIPFACVAVALAAAQGLGGSGTIQGSVKDGSGAVIPGARVEIANAVTGFNRQTETDEQGVFLFHNVPQAGYHLSVTAPGFKTLQQDVTVRGSVPVALDLAMKIAASGETVEVNAEASDLLETDTTAHTDIDEKLIAKVPMENSTSGMSQVLTLASPGVVADSNGFFHPLGDHAQTSFSVDNQQISDQQSRVYSTQLSMSAVQSMEVISGVAPAEYGDKTSLVAVVTTKSGLGLKKPTGSVQFNYGSFGNTGATVNYGFGGMKFGNFVSVNGLNTGRFLDSPEFQPLHDHGNSEAFFDRFDLQPTSKDTVHLNLFGAHTWFQAPNTFDQQTAGQDQRQNMKTFNIAPGWTHLFNNSTLLTVNGYVRQDRLQYYPSADLFNDQPETVAQGRRLTDMGARSDLSYSRGRNNLKAGVQISRTLLSENFAFAITDPTNNPVCLGPNGDPVLTPSRTDPAACGGLGLQLNPNVALGLVPFDLTRGGTLFRFADKGTIDRQGMYAQGALTLGPTMLTLGLREDHYSGLTEKWATQPRLGISHQVRKTNTILRASYGRTIETPYNENLLLSSATGTGGLATNVFGSTSAQPLRPGIRNEFNVGFEQAFGRYAVIDANYFWKHTRNAFDFNTLSDTPIAFPISWNKSKLDGFSVRVSMPEFHGLRAFTVMGHTRARFFNPEVGGLFFDTNPPTGVFRIDHDQAFEQTTNVQYSFQKKRSGWLAFTWRYDSGLVAGAVTDYATALGFTPDQQAAIGLFCGSQVATLASPIASCSDSNRGALRVRIPADGTENDDKNPPRIAPRHLFDAGMGFDNVLKGDRYKLSVKLTAVNLTNKVALYNFLSTFSGTHFVTPRSYQAEIGFSF